MRQGMFGKSVAELGHPLDQVALCNKQINRKLYSQRPHQFIDTVPDLGPVGCQGLRFTTQ